ncbi:cutinase family protein [Rhodococcus sp. NPDC058481]|uniref:cutinase family protein n=1 Tax=unclassified Rhodococcus (in: high G+C Gram-positive bacteria) TaxID=192944 RepID=UPI0036515051
MTRHQGLRGRVLRPVALTIAATTTMFVGVGVGTVPAQAQSSWLDQLVAGECPDLYALGVQGTGESSDDAPVKADTGMLGNVMAPMLKEVQELGASADRAYVPYPSGFGGAVQGGKASYTDSVAGALANLEDAAKTIVQACPKVKLAVVGYSQGAHAVSMFLQKAGEGKGAVPATAIAAGAEFGSPTRAEGSGPFPGTKQKAPSPVPGTSGEAVKALPPVSLATPTGAGIGPTADLASTYGKLNGRVLSACAAGDLACDAPPNAPIARAVVNVAGQSEVGGDPFVAMSTIGHALGQTAFNFAVDFVNEDVQVPKNSIENLSIKPKKTISQRLAEASDPRATPPTGQEALSALMKVGLTGLNAAVSVVKKVATPETIAQVAAVGLSNPAAAFAVIAAKTVNAVVKLVPPTTSQRLVKNTFSIVQNEVKANKDLFDLTALSKYRDIAKEHGSYGSTPATSTGKASTDFVASWIAAAAADLAGDSDGTSASTSTKTTSTTPKSTTTTAVTTSESSISETPTTTTAPTTTVATTTPGQKLSQDGV